MTDSDDLVHGMSDPFALDRRAANPLFAQINLQVLVDWREADEMLLLHINGLTTSQLGDIVTHGAADHGDVWRPAWTGTLPVKTGIPVGYFGFGRGGTVCGSLTLCLAPRTERTLTGTAFVEHDRIENQPPYRRYLCQIGGQYRDPLSPIERFTLSTMRGTPFRIEAFSAIAIG